MSNQLVFYDNGIMDLGKGPVMAIDGMQREKVLKDNINLYYDDYYLKPKKKKSTKAKRSHSKRPGARGRIKTIFRCLLDSRS